MQSLKQLALAGICFCFTSVVYAQEQPSNFQPDMPGPASRLSQSGNAQAAVSMLRERVKSPDASASDFITLANNLKSLSLSGEAIRTLQTAQQKFPDDTEILFQLGLAYIADGKPKEAVSILDKLTAIEPDNSMAFSAKGVAFDKAGNHFAAQELYNIALNRDPSNVAILNNLAMSLILDKRTQEAIEILEPLYQRAAGNSKVRHNLALAYGIAGRTKEAKELSMQDLSEEQTQQNLLFYKHYTTLQKDQAPVALYNEDNQQVHEPLLNDAAEDNIEKDHTLGPEASTEPPASAEKLSRLAPAAGHDTHQATQEEPPFGWDAEYSYPTLNQH